MDINCIETHLIYQELAQAVSQKFLGLSLNKKGLLLGPLEVNDYSICFGLETITLGGQKGVYIKIPKVDERKSDIYPIPPADRILALEEYRSLLKLAVLWQSDNIKVDFIKPLEYLDKYNAIVTEKVYGKDLLGFFRRCDIQRRLTGTPNPDRMHQIMDRLGKALVRYHHQEMSATIFNSTKTIAKITKYCSDLESYNVKKSYLENITSGIGQFCNYQASTHMVPNIKGLDIRNVLLDANSHLFMLDPGKIKVNHKEADLARFIATCRIIYWGNLLFFPKLCPHESYETSFLKGYYGQNFNTCIILRISLIKELIRNWLIAHRALDLKSWPATVKIFVRRTYIDPFYLKHVNQELNRLLARG